MRSVIRHCKSLVKSRLPLHRALECLVAAFFDVTASQLILLQSGAVSPHTKQVSASHTSGAPKPHLSSLRTTVPLPDLWVALWLLVLQGQGSCWIVILT